jgi:hypothetical protein
MRATSFAAAIFMLGSLFGSPARADPPEVMNSCGSPTNPVAGPAYFIIGFADTHVCPGGSFQYVLQRYDNKPISTKLTICYQPSPFGTKPPSVPPNWAIIVDGFAAQCTPPASAGRPHNSQVVQRGS